MATIKRYVAEIDFYVCAETDEQAIEKAREIAKEINDKEDNDANLFHLVEQPFGTIGNRVVFGASNHKEESYWKNEFIKATKAFAEQTERTQKLLSELKHI